MKKLYGIFGWPVTHSLSPGMHNAAFHELGIDAVYLPFAVAPEHLEHALSAIRTLGICGVNLTVPHKQAALHLLDHVEESARMVGAVNVVARQGKSLVGFNTDAEGLSRALAADSIKVDAKQVLVIGAGGAARAAVVSLSTQGAATIWVRSRREEQAVILVNELREHFPNTEMHYGGLADGVSDVVERVGLVVNATSATLDSGTEAKKLVEILQLSNLATTACVVDLVYGKQGTLLTRTANELGLKATDGKGMLLQQGAIAFERWTGKPAPLEVMQSALAADSRSN